MHRAGRRLSDAKPPPRGTHGPGMIRLSGAAPALPSQAWPFDARASAPGRRFFLRSSRRSLSLPGAREPQRRTAMKLKFPPLGNRLLTVLGGRGAAAEATSDRLRDVLGRDRALSVGTRAQTRSVPVGASTEPLRP